MAGELEWLESNRNRVYPFRDDTVAFASPNESYAPSSFFVDAYLTYRAVDASNDVDDSWCIEQLTVDTFDLVLVNVNSGATLALGVPVQSTVIGTYKTAVWASEADGVTITMLLRWTDHPLSSTSGVVLTFVSQPLFAPRCLERQPLRVDSIDAGNGVNWLDSGEIGDVAEGSNIKLEVDPQTALTRTLDLRQSQTRPTPRRILITALPGAGTGRADTGACAETIDYIAAINNVTGNRGQFTLDGDSCYRVGVRADELGEVVPNTLGVDNDCEACCTCDEYVDAFEQLRALKNLGLDIKLLLNDTVDVYKVIKEIWSERLACIGTGCQTRAFVYSFTGWLISVQVWVGNVQNCESSGATVSVQFPAGFDPLYIPGSGMLYNAQDNYQQIDPTESPVRTFTLSDNSGTPAGSYKLFVMAFRLQPTEARVDGDSVSLTITSVACGGSPEALTQSIVMKANTAKP